MHGPDVINGQEDENLFLGVVTNVHNKPSLNYQWFHNGNPLCSGIHRSLIKVSEPGKYYCKVKYGKNELQSSEVDVLILVSCVSYNSHVTVLHIIYKRLLSFVMLQ